MPNWCDNKVSLTGDKHELFKLKSAIEQGSFFDYLIPTPQEHLNGDGWYDFRIRNWGCKWDADVQEVLFYEQGDEGLLTVKFLSPWSPPIEIYNHLLSLGFKVHAYYFEPGMAFFGIYDDGDDECLSYVQFKDIPKEIQEEFSIEEEDFIY